MKKTFFVQMKVEWELLDATSPSERDVQAWTDEIAAELKGWLEDNKNVPGAPTVCEGQAMVIDSENLCQYPGILELDERGVIYFHSAFDGSSKLRISGLPTPLPIEWLKEFGNGLDIAISDFQTYAEPPETKHKATFNWEEK